MKRYVQIAPMAILRAIATIAVRINVLNLTLFDQIQSGKNRILITRKGHRYPPKRFADWRDAAVLSFRIQAKTCPELPYTKRCRLEVAYTPGDARTRDVAGMLDALCHCLERAGIVVNDGLIQTVSWRQFGPEIKPRLDLTLEQEAP